MWEFVPGWRTEVCLRATVECPHCNCGGSLHTVSWSHDPARDAQEESTTLH